MGLYKLFKYENKQKKRYSFNSRYECLLQTSLFHFPNLVFEVQNCEGINQRICVELPNAFKELRTNEGWGINFELHCINFGVTCLRSNWTRLAVEGYLFSDDILTMDSST